MDNYTYDNRPGKTASKEDDAEKLEELIGLLADAIQPAEAILSELEKDVDTDLDAARKHAREVRDALSTAESVETIRDFGANVQDARTELGLLETALKKAKKDAKEDDDSVALEAIEEATSTLRELRRELASIQEELTE